MNRPRMPNRNQQRPPNNRNPSHQNFSSSSNQIKPNTMSSPPSIASGTCVVCNSKTVIVCQRCGDYYCSPTCQQKDWPKHRYICFAMPQLVISSSRIVKELPTLSMPSFETASESGVASQHRKWVNTTSPNSVVLSPTSIPDHKHQQQQRQQQMNNNHQDRQQQMNHQQDRQQQMNNNQDRQQPQNSQQSYQRQSRQQQPPNNQQNPSAQLNSREPEKHDSPVNIGKLVQVAFPKNESTVLITAVSSSNRVFVRPIDKNQNEEYCQVVKIVNAYGKTAVPLKRMPTRNTFAITQYNNDGIYYRVQVVSVKSENQIHVVFFDFGNEDIKKLSELREISKEIAELKQYIVMVKLRNVPYIRQSDEKLKKFLKSFEDTEVKIRYKEKPICDLIIFDVDESLNEKINKFIRKMENNNNNNNNNNIVDNKPSQPPKPKVEEMQEKIEKSMSEVKLSASAEPSPPVSAKTRPSQLSKPIMTPPFETITLPVNGKNLNVMVVDNSLIDFGYFSCVLIEDKQNLKSIHEHLSEYADSRRPYKPKLDEYCLASYKGSWHRAKVTDCVSSDTVEVVFIDILNEATVSTQDIRRYSMDLELPCKTTLCIVDGLPAELSPELVDYLRGLLQPGSEHKISEVKSLDEEDSGVIIVKINQITQWLAENGFV